MELMTPELEAKFKEVGRQENVPLADKVVVAKFFAPVGAATWLATEYDPRTKLFFGFAGLFGLSDPSTAEWGYFSLEELQSVSLPFGLGIERDLYLKEGITFREYMDHYENVQV